MQTHSSRNSYELVDEGLLDLPANIVGSCPHALGATPSNGTKASTPPFKFVRLFGKADVLSGSEREEMIRALEELGRLMNEEVLDPQPDTQIPSGYTYLGQFIAHEITFDPTKGIPEIEELPDNGRSPQIDLDSLYGSGCPSDVDNARLYESDLVTLKIGLTTKNNGLGKTFPNDLYRDSKSVAVVSDDRNDENLPLAQTHVAFAHFHNNWVKKLRETSKPETLFQDARLQVCRHFQWIILHDYLPRMVDQAVLDRVRCECLSQFNPEGFCDPYMPLEFSAGAFRFGHSMIRSRYEWNYYHSSGGLGNPMSPSLIELFNATKFSGNLNADPTLPSDWVIDWRRFYKFDGLPYEGKTLNFGRAINTIFDLHLNKITNYPHDGLPESRTAITVRNLLRGFALGLNYGEEVARQIAPHIPGAVFLTREQILTEPHDQVLAHPRFRDKTPLWYYILKEAEVLQEGRKLGPVGSYIVASTLIKMIMNTPESIFHEPQWRPVSERRTEYGEPRFEMADLLHFADVVNPIAL